MALPWFRMYAEFIDDDVIEFLSFEDQRHYVFILCMKCAGYLDKDYPQDYMRDAVIARKLGLQGEALANAKERLLDVGVIDFDWQPLGWEKRQFKSDHSNERVSKYRKNKEKNKKSNVTTQDRYSNAPDTDTEQKKNVRFSDDDLAIANEIYGGILKLNPKARKPNLEKWADDIRKTRQLDDRTPEEIRRTFAWANKDDFWQANILSPATLRKQFDRLSIQMKKQKPEEPEFTGGKSI